MYKYFKRIVDFFIALVALVILFIPLMIVAIIIKLDSKGPVIFKQERLGKNGVPLKFGSSDLCVLVQKKKVLVCIRSRVTHVLPVWVK